MISQFNWAAAFRDMYERVSFYERDRQRQAIDDDPHYIPQTGGSAIFEPPDWSAEQAGVRELRNPIAGGPPGTWDEASRRASTHGGKRSSESTTARTLRERSGGGPVLSQPAFNAKLEARRRLRHALGQSGKGRSGSSLLSSSSPDVASPSAANQTMLGA